jgi:hypothetical protein
MSQTEERQAQASTREPRLVRDRACICADCGNGGSGKLSGNGSSRKHSRRAATNSSSSTSVGCGPYIDFM